MITKECFCATMKWLEEFEQKCDTVDEALHVFGKDFNGFFISEVSDNIIKLLSNAFKDEENWLSYCVYELDYLKDYNDGCAVDSNNKVINLSTWENVYDFLIEYYYSTKENDAQNFIKCAAYNVEYGNSVCFATKERSKCNCNGNALDCSFYDIGCVH